MKGFVILAVAALAAASGAEAQSVSAKDLQEQLGIKVDRWSNDGRMIAKWSFREQDQLKGLEFEGARPMIDEERGLVFHPAKNQPAVAMVRELHFRSPCRVSVEMIAIDADAPLFIVLKDGANSQLQTVCFANLGPGRRERAAGMFRLEGEKRQSVGSVQRFEAVAGTPYRLTCELKDKALRFFIGASTEPVSSESSSPHQSFQVGLVAPSGDVVVRNLQIDGSVVVETVRKLANAANAASKAPTARKEKVRGEAGWKALELEMLLDRSQQLIDWAKNEEDEEAARACAAAADLFGEADVRTRLGTLQKELEKHPSSAMLAWLVGNARLRCGEAEQAVECFQRASRLAPAVPEFWRDLGGAYSDLGDDPKARSSFDKAEELWPQMPWVDVLRAEHHLRRGSLDAAVQAMDAALKKRPKSKALATATADLKRLLSRPDWKTPFHFEKGAYVVESDVSAKACADLASRLNLYRRFLESAFPLPVKQAAPCRVWIFDSEEQYHVFSDTLAQRIEHSLGVYHPLIKTLLLFHTMSAAETQEVLFHEAFHQYLDIAVSRPPIWFNEGMAEYYGATTFDAAYKATEGGLQAGRLTTLRSRPKGSAGGLLPFKTIMLLPPSAFMASDPGRNYAQSWAMVHWFKRGPDVRARETFQRYVAAVLAGKPQQACFDETFGALDPGDLDRWQREFVTYLGSLP